MITVTNESKRLTLFRIGLFRAAHGWGGGDIFARSHPE